MAQTNEVIDLTNLGADKFLDSAYVLGTDLILSMNDGSTITVDISASAAERGGIAWSSVYNYVANDITVQSGVVYIAIQASLNSVPSTSPADWQPLINETVATPETGAATYTPDFDSSNYFEYTLSQNTTLVNPTDTTVGDTGTIVIKEDAVGGWTIAFGANYTFPTGAPAINLTAESTNVFKYTVTASNRILMEFVADYV